MAMIFGARYSAVELLNRDVGIFASHSSSTILVRLRGRHARELWAKLESARHSPKDVDAAIAPHLSPGPLP